MTRVLCRSGRLSRACAVLSVLWLGVTVARADSLSGTWAGEFNSGGDEVYAESIFYSDGTTGGYWDVQLSDFPGQSLSMDPTGTYTYNAATGLIRSTASGTATGPYGTTAAYTLTVNGTVMGQDYYGAYAITFDNPPYGWPSGKTGQFSMTNPDYQGDTTGIPTILGPSGTVGTQPTLEWSAAQGGEWYDLYIMRNGQFYFETWLQTTEFQVFWHLDPGNYSWYVRAWGAAGGLGDWSSQGAFTVQSNAPGATSLVYPIDNAALSDARPTFEWNSVANAQWYWLYISHDSGTHFEYWTQATTFTSPLDLPNGGYSWWICTWGNGEFGQWSGEGAFSVQAGGGSGSVDLLSPQNGATVSSNPPTLEWSSVAGAEWYWLAVRLNDVPLFDTWTQSTRYTHTSELPSGDYTWYVATWGPATGISTFYGPSAFEVPGDDPPGAVSLSSPANGANFPEGDTVSFAWTSAENVEYYRLYVECNGVACMDEWTDRTYFYPSQTFSAGSYQWWVQTWNSAGFGDWSSGRSFTVEAEAQVPQISGVWIGSYTQQYNSAGFANYSMPIIFDCYQNGPDVSMTFYPESQDMYGQVTEQGLSVSGTGTSWFGEDISFAGTVSGNSITGTYEGSSSYDSFRGIFEAHTPGARADLTGTWSVSASDQYDMYGEYESVSYTMSVSQSGSELYISIPGLGSTSGRVEGDTFVFVLDDSLVGGTVSGNRISGYYYYGTGWGTFTGSR